MLIDHNIKICFLLFSKIPSEPVTSVGEGNPISIKRPLFVSLQTNKHQRTKIQQQTQYTEWDWSPPTPPISNINQQQDI